MTLKDMCVYMLCISKIVHSIPPQLHEATFTCLHLLSADFKMLVCGQDMESHFLVLTAI